MTVVNGGKNYGNCRKNSLVEKIAVVLERGGVKADFSEDVAWESRSVRIVAGRQDLWPLLASDSRP